VHVSIHVAPLLLCKILIRMGLYLIVFGKCVKRKSFVLLLSFHRYTQQVIAHIQAVYNSW
jgi:Ni,Fe-hydrogenase I cytochrome b subunit